jgi:hypothetical protein
MENTWLPGLFAIWEADFRISGRLGRTGFDIMRGVSPYDNRFEPFVVVHAPQHYPVQELLIGSRHYAGDFSKARSRDNDADSQTDVRNAGI